jgi:hypothetical protein
LQLFAYSQEDVDKVSPIFSKLREKYQSFKADRKKKFSYDLFLSYCHENTKEALGVIDYFQAKVPGVRIFFDRNELNVGSAWQQKIYEALDSCRKVISLYTPEYLESKVCCEELNIAICRERETSENIFYPLYVYSASLPTYVKVWQYDDCRENNLDKIEQACDKIIESLKDPHEKDPSEKEKLEVSSQTKGKMELRLDILEKQLEQALSQVKEMKDLIKKDQS